VRRASHLFDDFGSSNPHRYAATPNFATPGSAAPATAETAAGSAAPPAWANAETELLEDDAEDDPEDKTVLSADEKVEREK
jgi:transcription elongation factor